MEREITHTERLHTEITHRERETQRERERDKRERDYTERESTRSKKIYLSVTLKCGQEFGLAMFRSLQCDDIIGAVTQLATYESYK